MRAVVPMAIRICVAAGSCADMLLYNSANFGTTKVIRNTIRQITSTISRLGYTIDSTIFLRTPNASF